MDQQRDKHRAATRRSREASTEEKRHRTRLKEFRAKLLMNQKELSECSGVSPWIISKIECGQRLPHVEIAYRLAQTLGVTIEDIFFPDGISILPISDSCERKGGL